jgi:dTDP-4-amino-4,6-dideoxygalactose transaminase
MNVPLLDLKGQYATIRDEVREALDRVIESQHFILGPEVEALEREVSEYSQCRFAIGLSSGTDALLAALMAFHIGPGDEVLTTSYSFFATAGVIARLGATPVFVDIDAETFNIDPSLIEAAVTTRTRAIIPVHLYGQMTEMDAILEIGRRHKIPIIEDAAQAIGAELNGRRAGSLGEIGCLSFFPSKNLGGFGDGGMAITNSAELADRVVMLRNHGFRTRYYNEILGGNFRLDAIQAAVLRVKLKYLDRWTEGRQRNAALYREQIRSAQLPIERPGRRHIYNQFVIRSSKRDALMAHLKQNEIASEVYYPVPLHLQKCFSDLGYRKGSLPVSEQAAETTLALPIYPELTPEMIRYVASAINSLSG